MIIDVQNIASLCIKRVYRIVLLVTLSICTMSASAGFVYQPVSISSNLPIAQPLTNVINQSGLSQNYQSGITDFDTFVNSTRHSLLESDNGIQINPFNTTGVITFGLGSNLNIESIALWGSNLNNSFVAQFFTDNDNNFSNGTTGAMGQLVIPGRTNPIPASVLSFAPTTASFIHFQFVSSTNVAPAFGELAVEQSTTVPEPTALTLLCLGLLGLSLAQRKKM